MSYVSPWSNDQTKYLKENYMNLSYKEIGNVVNKTPKQVQSKVYLLGLSKRKGDWWSEEQIQFLKENYMSLSYKEISNILNKTKSAVQTKLKKLGLRKIYYDNTKRILNEEYFRTIDDEHKAYWLGFISADGCIYNYEKNVFGFKLELQKSDSNMISKFIEDINGNFDVIYGKSKCNEKTFETAKVCFKNKVFVNYLLQYITFNKTNIIRIPTNIPSHLMRHYIRGFSDGDGCFYCGNKSNRKSFEIVGNSEFMLYDIQKELKQNDIQSMVYQRKNGNYKLGIYNFKDLSKLKSYLYDDTTIFMERKYKKVQKILKLPS